ncbi:keywimysin-related RiPP [Parafrankia discariae]|uniref:keywimysin-related RiPP n=1 Tax=Parafrankia discariae TaxID=365528 RepID=UPI00036358FF|nr:lasso RiPP family leader peptide-containing protein [Parafrankia discariae]
MKATYEAPTLQAQGSFRDVTRGFVFVFGSHHGGWGWGHHGGWGWGHHGGWGWGHHGGWGWG